MSKTTRATVELHKLGVAFEVHIHAYDPDADHKGLQAAEALGESPRRVLKTLIAEVDGKPVCVVVPSNHEVSMKKLAAAVGGKAAKMIAPLDAERLTGYHVGGISPFAQKRRLPKVLERSAMDEEIVFMNGGQRGFQVSMAPESARTALAAIVADVIA
ncbi:MAG: Cys-tRNA(Pro) deacylase [Thermomicrobiales bacterium]